ncbi:VOC family protein [Lutimonas zeaxanthinifaciens]|uniref:VOC family protein n=1 Tax=Lutimonas zeaxanthinifaciens TaxID=3060215 RepID=UPI00265CD8F0|nr:VOC family protein [Lutimonas sp. YSD2104]WKK67094.1 VOC family protein [Lutimonas sp. YSD2104]
MISRNIVMRVGRPTDHLEEITKMYTEGLGFEIIGGFDNHGDFSGRMVGHPKHHFHLEFTTHSKEKAGRAPTLENLLVFYLPDDDEYAIAIERISNSGFKKVKSFNPYWEGGGQTFEDLDGYRVVLSNAESPF